MTLYLKITPQFPGTANKGKPHMYFCLMVQNKSQGLSLGVPKDIWLIRESLL